MEKNAFSLKEMIVDLRKDMAEGFKGVHERQDKTNGKVRRLFLYLVAVAAFAAGMGLNNGSLVLKLLGL